MSVKNCSMRSINRCLYKRPSAGIKKNCSSSQLMNNYSSRLNACLKKKLMSGCNRSKNGNKLFTKKIMKLSTIASECTASTSIKTKHSTAHAHSHIENGILNKKGKNDAKDNSQLIDWANSALYIRIRKRQPMSEYSESKNTYYEFHLDKVINLLENPSSENLSLKELRKCHKKALNTLQALTHSLSLEQHFSSQVFSWQQVVLQQQVGNAGRCQRVLEDVQGVVCSQEDASACVCSGKRTRSKCFE